MVNSDCRQYERILKIKNIDQTDHAKPMVSFFSQILYLKRNFKRVKIPNLFGLENLIV